MTPFIDDTVTSCVYFVLCRECNTPEYYCDYVKQHFSLIREILHIKQKTPIIAEVTDPLLLCTTIDIITIVAVTWLNVLVLKPTM